MGAIPLDIAAYLDEGRFLADASMIDSANDRREGPIGIACGVGLDSPGLRLARLLAASTAHR